MENENVPHLVHKINFNSIDSMHRPAKWSPPDVLRTIFHHLNKLYVPLVLKMSDEK